MALFGKLGFQFSKVNRRKLSLCKILSFVTDSTANMVFTREIINKELEFEGLTCGYCA